MFFFEMALELNRTPDEIRSMSRRDREWMLGVKIARDFAAREMRRMRPVVPIIIFSGALTLPDRVMAMIDGFVSTSEEPEVLLRAIDQLLPHPAEIRAS